MFVQWNVQLLHHRYAQAYIAYKCYKIVIVDNNITKW